MTSLARSWSRAVPSLREVDLRVHYLRAEMMSRPLLAVAEALDALAGFAEQADATAREVLAAAVTALADPTAEDLVVALRQLADHGRAPGAREAPAASRSAPG